MGELWLKQVCPKCQKVNWIYSGDSLDADMSKLDTEGCKCWSCAHTWLFNEKLAREDLGEPDKSVSELLDEYSFIIENGKETPGDYSRSN